MKQRSAASLTCLLLVSAVPAWAGHDNDVYDYAKVLEVRPVTEIVQVPEYQQVCRETPVQRRVDEYRSPAPAIFGALIGGVIGNQLARGHGHGRSHGPRGYAGRHRHGHGGGRAAATVAGAAIGGLVGSGMQRSEYPPRYYQENVQTCGTETRWHEEERVVAYDVSWKYRGRTYHSRMAEPPGERIAIRVSVAPIEP